MLKFRDSEFRKRYGPAIVALGWLVIGIATLMMAAQMQDIPGRNDLRKASGIIDSLHEDNRYVRYGPNVYMLRLRLRDSDTEYRIDSGRLNDSRAYFRASRALRRGNAVTLWYEAHPDFGNRLWQIDLEGRRLIDYRETFNHETDEQMNTWLILLAYLVASCVVVPLLVMWHRRTQQNTAQQLRAVGEQS